MKTFANRIWLAAVVASLLIIAGPARAGDEPPAPVKGASVEGITEYTFGNGLQVLLFRDPSKPTVTVNVTYRVGSRHEGRGEAGMAHLLEHMVFKGTPTYPNIWGALEDHGASFNGSTWVDRTNYFETLPASDENLEFALRMEADRMVNSTISGEELAKEMTVVRNEFEMGENDPSGVLSERMMSAAYLWHNYGKSTIGNRSDIERVPVENLRRFYRKYYQPDNATLLVAGRFDTEQTLDLINRSFGAIPRPERSLENTYTEEPAQDGPRMVTLKRVGDVASAGLIYHVPAGPHPEFPAVQILEGILTDQPSGLLYKALVETGLATRVSGAAFAWAEPGVLEISAQVAENKDPEMVLDKMIEVVERSAADQVTQDAVERIKAQSLKAIKLGMTNSARIGVRLSESIAQGDWRMFFIHRDRLKEVEVADVQQVARKYLAEANRTAGMFVPTEKATRVAVEPTPDVRSLVRGYEGSETVAAGEEFTPTPAYVEERTIRRTLPSGIKLALLPMEMRGNAVQAGLRFHFGREEDLTGHETAVQLIPSMLMRGTTQRDHQALRDEIDRLESRIFVGSAGGGGRGRRGGGSGETGPGMVGAFIESDRAHVVPSIELLGEILRQPAFAEDEFRVVVDQERAQLEERLSDPMARGMNAMSRAMNPWPPESIHYVPTLEEQIARLESVSLGAVKDLYAKHYGAGNLEVAVVGDFDRQEVEAAIERVFGSWKSPSPYQRIAKPHRDVESAELAIHTPDKEMAIVGMGTNVAMRDDDPDYPALVMASYVLGESAKARLMTRIRHEEGLSYGARAYFRSDDQDQRASLMGTAICAPRNAEKALHSMREVIQRWIADGITEEELAESKSSYALKFESRLATERFLVGELLSGFQVGRTLAWHADLLSKIQALSTADVKNALEKRFAKAAFVAVKAGDLEAKAEPDPAAASPEPVGALPEGMQRFDKNGDGKLQESEAPERMRPFFARLDTNGDGAIDAAEAHAMRGGPDGRGSGAGDRWQRLLRFDENDNGKIERSEAPQRLVGRFDDLDKNRDGALDEGELQREEE